MFDQNLAQQIGEVAAKAQWKAVAVAVHDVETGREFSHDGDRVFHAASTIKVAILFALLKTVESGRARWDDWLHVRNRFRSLADGAVFRVDSERDAAGEVHRHIGRAMKVGDLAHAMITRSSNLATNLLLDLIGVEDARKSLAEAGIVGVGLRRGVEDQAAFERGINNEVTARSLVELFRLFLEGDALSTSHRQLALDILLAQEFRDMIPAGLPESARVAHKTGEISTACHDAGIVFLPKRKPYVISILTEFDSGREAHHKPVAEISKLVYENLRHEI